jgi:UDP-GlcNAc:undecaprenyl-phosphate GlcNAc-1-phosphate transferase
LMGMMNTVNFLEGLDGLSAGVTAIVSIVLLVHMLRVGHYGPALLPAALLGTMLGFMPFNFAPAKIFLGSGAITLGYLIGTLSLVAGARVATVLLVMGIPIVDVAWQIVNRWRHGRSMNEGDRGHLHYRLQDLGWSQSQIVFLYWAFCASFGVLALLVSSGILKLIAILCLAAWVAVVLSVLSRRAEKRQAATTDPPASNRES